MSEPRIITAREITTTTGSKVTVCVTTVEDDGHACTRIGFRSKEGKLLHFSLSAEALGALRLLLTEPASGDPTTIELDPPPPPQWHYSVRLRAEGASA